MSGPNRDPRDPRDDALNDWCATLDDDEIKQLEPVGELVRHAFRTAWNRGVRWEQHRDLMERGRVGD